MTFAEKLERASKRTKDVRILLNGELLTERDRLAEQVALAETQAQGWLGGSADEARQALIDFEDQIETEFVLVRIEELPQEKWRLIQAMNPVGDKKHPVDQMYGFNAVAAAIDAVELSAVIVDGDETVKPTKKQWRQVWEAINAGDMARITETVVDLNESTGYMDYVRLGKR